MAAACPNEPKLGAALGVSAAADEAAAPKVNGLEAGCEAAAGAAPNATLGWDAGAPKPAEAGVAPKLKAAVEAEAATAAGALAFSTSLAAASDAAVKADWFFCRKDASQPPLAATAGVASVAAAGADAGAAAGVASCSVRRRM